MEGRDDDRFTIVRNRGQDCGCGGGGGGEGEGEIGIGIGIGNIVQDRVISSKYVLLTKTLSLIVLVVLVVLVQSRLQRVQFGFSLLS